MDEWMTDEVKVLITGGIILALAVLFLMVMSIGPLLEGNGTQGQGMSSGSSGSAGSDEWADYSGGDYSSTPETPTVTPVVISSPPATTVPAPVQNRVVSYVTIAPKPTDDLPILHDLSQNIPRRSEEGFFTIYSLPNVVVGTNFPYITYTLVNPPLYLDFEVTFTNITDEKYYEYKIKANKYEVTKTNIRPYENAYFHVTVRDMDTGEIVAEDGVGVLDGLQMKKQIALYKGGHYLFEFTGRTATVTLTMKVKKEGNIP